ncbi:MAG: helix-turn-helix transcriptional regulator, partial [Lachnospiraceae bacterium]|nr:helix-turn-helix transcriptional regulator [Lachnospiraceae bacterium]
MVNKIVGQRIKSLRNEYGITQDLLATGIFLTNDVRVSKGMISNWESGRYEPSLYYVQEIARYFGVSLDYLIGLTDEKEPFRD